MPQERNKPNAHVDLWDEVNCENRNGRRHTNCRINIVDWESLSQNCLSGTRVGPRELSKLRTPRANSSCFGEMRVGVVGTEDE